MEESRKKPVMLGVIVVCFVLAGVVYLRTRPSGLGLEKFRGKMMWVLCRNSECGHSWQMDKEEYHKFIQKNADPKSPLPPPITCKGCGEPSVYRAVKCAKCGATFEEGTVTDAFADKCPKCGYSQTAVNRREVAEKRRAEKEAKREAKDK